MGSGGIFEGFVGLKRPFPGSCRVPIFVAAECFQWFPGFVFEKLFIYALRPGVGPFLMLRAYGAALEEYSVVIERLPEPFASGRVS